MEINEHLEYLKVNLFLSQFKIINQKIILKLKK